MALFRLKPKLQLKAAEREALNAFPDQPFEMDFLLLVPGACRIQLNHTFLGVSAKHPQMTAFTAHQMHNGETKCWLPDYLAGFALNLGETVMRLQQGEREKASARFVDEPMDLRFTVLAPLDGKPAPAMYRVSFFYDSNKITEANVPAVVAAVETARFLTSLTGMLLEVNPRLLEYPDVHRMTQLASALLASTTINISTDAIGTRGEGI